MKAEVFEAAHDSLGAAGVVVAPLVCPSQNVTLLTNALSLSRAELFRTFPSFLPWKSDSLHEHLTQVPVYTIATGVRCIILRAQTVGTRIGITVIANRGRVFHTHHHCATARKT